MKISLNEDGIIIVDNFLDEETFQEIAHQIENDSFEITKLGSDKYYLLNSGDIYKNKKKYYSKALPWENSYEKFMTKFLSFIEEHGTKFEKPIKDVSLKVHIYRSGAEIHWHKDWMHNASYSFYAHKKWDYSWGGNLLVAAKETAENPQIEQSGRLLNLEQESKTILNPGLGRYIAPLPNRLVIIPPNLYHKVERVDHSSGNNCRVSLTGFIYNE
jgi:Rps23 Pro-64 3,4-dihydroxylase Tpa1-like proline 4-hydroxylase